MPSRIKRPNELIRVDFGECGLPNRFVRARLRESWMSASSTASPVLTTADLLAPTTYFGAGQTTISSGITFTYHQIVSYKNLVYDPSTAAVAGGTPTMGMTFAAYVAFAFPGQAAIGAPITQDVTNLTVK
jgi:hypothetical protein